ncbi:MAG: AI-2E family transporter, partial [Thermoflexibacteraceae bacterium]
MLINKTTLNAVIIALLVGCLVWLFSNIVTYFICAFILTAILKVPTNSISQLHILGMRLPRIVGVAMSFGLLLSIFSLFGLLFVPLFTAQLKILASNDFIELMNKIDKPMVALEKWLIEGSFVKKPEGFLVDTLNTKVTEALENLQFSVLINNVLNTAPSIIIGAFMILLFTLFMLLEKGMFRNLLVNQIPNKYFEVSINTLYKIEKLMSNYLLGLLLQMLSIFTTTSFGLIIAGVEYAITIGLFAALVNVVPFIGPITSTTFGLFVAVSTTSLDISNPEVLSLLVIKVCTVFGVVQFIDAFIMQPIIFSKSVKAHPLEIFVAIMAGANLAGSLGMVVAVPVYTILKVTFIELRKG